MTPKQAIGWSLVAWLAVGIFWLIVTRSFHPTWELAVIATGTLVVCYATAAYMNHLVLIPRYWRAGRPVRYATTLLVTMALLTAVALAVIRGSYLSMLGPDPDPNGLYIHFGIDFFGMAVHLVLAAGLVWVVGKLMRVEAEDASRL